MRPPFGYPETHHIRILTPIARARYQDFKEDLRQEFRRQCVYCRRPDGFGSLDEFGVDHYRPRRKFPLLSTDYTNLFYACNTCNRLKGDYWPNAEEDAYGCVVVNPCDHIMSEHLRFAQLAVEGRSAPGKWMEALLDLNSPEALRMRDLVTAAVGQFKTFHKELRSQLRLVEKAIGKNASGQRRSQLENGRDEIKDKLSKNEGRLRSLCAWP